MHRAVQAAIIAFSGFPNEKPSSFGEIAVSRSQISFGFILSLIFGFLIKNKTLNIFACGIYPKISIKLKDFGCCSTKSFLRLELQQKGTTL